MIKKSIALFAIIFLVNYNGIAQKQSNYWYFGKTVGLNFNQNPPQVLNDSRMNATEGSASIADNNGNLLFYTNGVAVFNKDHEIMVNGNGILGDQSSTNNTIITNLPGNDSLYYLFTIGATTQLTKGFRYSIININKQNGLGEVEVKNIVIEVDTYEKLAAVRHCNRRDIWITIKKWDNDAYNTYLLTASGLNFVPIISNTGLVVGGSSNNAIGALKFSADGTKLVALHSLEYDVIELMRFNHLTGAITNPIIIKPNSNPIGISFTGVYGAEFSPNGSLLYVSSNNSNAVPNVLYQFDISILDSTSISNSKQVIAQTNPWYAGALQAGPDGKIYYAQWKDTSLSVIENPNIYGAGCNFRYNKIKMANSGDPVQFGLPNFIASDLDTTYLPYDFIRSGSCSSFDVSFTLNKITGADSVKWNFGDGQTSTLLAPLHSYPSAGNYLVTLIIYKVDCGALADTVKHWVQVGITQGNFLPADTSLCEIKNFTISSLTNASQYLWNTGQTSTSVQITTAGIYWLDIIKNGCNFRDSIQINLNAPAFVNLGKDTTVCINKPVILNAGTANGNYLWSNGTTGKTIMLSTPGKYWVQLTNTDGCMASDTLTTTWGDCTIYIPSAFTPNGDGINETFGLINGISSVIFRMNIYNRYGQIVFTTTDPFGRWDGRFKNDPLPMGAYPWMITYKNKEGFIQTDKGTVMLIR